MSDRSPSSTPGKAARSQPPAADPERPVEALQPDPTGYCDAAAHPFHGPYHDQEYGVPVRDDQALFERLMLEINQAGLSWLTILKKREGFRSAYHAFAVDVVAAYDEDDRARLMADAGIIRNRLKINAAIENARRIQAMGASHGGFGPWLDAHHPRDLDGWKKLFKKTFVFTGGEIVHSFLMSTGYLPGAHRPSCPAYARIAQLSPPWMTAVANRQEQPVTPP